MKCPHCLTSIHGAPQERQIGEDVTSRFSVYWNTCPECGKFIVELIEEYDRVEGYEFPDTYNSSRSYMCYPKHMSRTPLPESVTDPYRSDYIEACNVLNESPKASAALSRRCLQAILRDVAKVQKGSLASEIDAILEEKNLPSHLSESLDAIRNIGNFAAHPIKSNSSGEIIDVEPGEAEWNLDVLEALFDYYFVQPSILKKKREALNEKLKAAGKPEMK